MIYALVGSTLASAILSALLVGWYKDATWQNTINEIKIEAANVLIVETDKVLKQERIAADRVRELEAQHVQTEKNLDVIQRRNRTLAAQLGGLRDPGRRPSRVDPVPGTPVTTGSIGDTTSTGFLSAEATEVLLAASAEADALASYARTCYEYVQSIKESYDH